MVKSKVVIARKAGRCWNESDGHYGLISQGDRVRALTIFPKDYVLGGYIQDGKPLRVRECARCLDRSEAIVAERAAELGGSRRP